MNYNRLSLSSIPLQKGVFRGKHKHYIHQQIEGLVPHQHEAYFRDRTTTYKGDRTLYKLSQIEI